MKNKFLIYLRVFEKKDYLRILNYFIGLVFKFKKTIRERSMCKQIKEHANDLNLVRLMDSRISWKIVGGQNIIFF